MGFYNKADDEQILAEIRVILSVRSSYGYKRVTAMLNKRRSETTRYNRKRIYRLMKKSGLVLPKNKQVRVHSGTGKVMTLRSNTRWCSDCFEIRCFNDERVHVGFSLDCSDREVISYVFDVLPLTKEHIETLMIESVFKRFGKWKTDRQIEWLTDRGSIYRSPKTQQTAKIIGLKSCFTAPYSPASNGMAESLVHTIKRDYVYVSDCSTAQEVIKMLPSWFYDYNSEAPHSALGMKSPLEFRKICCY